MSGLNTGDIWGPNRAHIERQEILSRIRNLTNKELAGQVGRIIDSEPHYRLVLGEVINRIRPESEITTMEQARRN